jgi:cyanophycin synthetase
VALELQNIAGMDCNFGKTISLSMQGVYHVLFEYNNEDAGVHAGEVAIKLVDTLAKGESYDLTEDLAYLTRKGRRSMFGPSTASIVHEASLKNIPYRRLNGNSLVSLGYGYKQKRLRATVAGTTHGIGIEIAKDKHETKKILGEAYIPVPRGILIYDEEDLRANIDLVPFPLVMKPVNGNHGRGITTDINDIEAAAVALKIASAVSIPVMIEEYISGTDYRLVVVDFKFIAAAKRTPAMVIGDGSSTIDQLVEDINSHPSRGVGHENILTKIVIDDSTREYLARKGISTDTVLKKGEALFLKDTANMSTGGTSEDVTDQVHPSIISMAERIARLVDLNICGIDVLAKDISEPLTRENGVVIEVNAGPGLRMHHDPSHGLARNVARPIIEMLFPGGDDGRIPIVAITGTNGKTTTTRLVAHMAKFAGKQKVGYTTTEGIYIQDEVIEEGDCTGPGSSETVLYDPTIDFAVLECARGGILRSGLAFDKCDISIVTNVTEDHLNLKDIHTLEEMARVKMVVPLTTKRDGFAILNAEDDLVYGMAEQLNCNIALFSMDPKNPRIVEHCEHGGLAAFVEEEFLIISHGTWKTRIDKIVDIPLTLQGRADAMIKNLMPATLVAIIQNFDIEKIRGALRSFVPSSRTTPGRMNIFKFPDFQLMVDYAHNVDGIKNLKQFIDKTQATHKIGIIGAGGDRRDEDIRNIGALSAEMFDEVIIRHDADMRGRPKDEMNELFMQGIRSVKPGLEVKIISDVHEAVQYALSHAKKGSFITVTTNIVQETIDFVKEKLKAAKQAASK